MKLAIDLHLFSCPSAGIVMSLPSSSFVAKGLLDLQRVSLVKVFVGSFERLYNVCQSLPGQLDVPVHRNKA